MRIDRVKLIAVMASLDLKVGQLAELSGVSRMTVSAIRGGKSCSHSTALKIARALGVDVSEILEEVKQ